MVDISPLPLVTSLAVWGVALSLIEFLWSNGGLKLWLCVMSLVVAATLWWRDVVREATYCGKHTKKVQRCVYLSMVMFIVSEAMFFFSFFFGFFFLALSPDVSLGCVWPPLGVEPLSYLSVPLLNTLLLLSSGVSVTWAHHGLLSGSYKEACQGLCFTLLAGMLFLVVQVAEYFEAPFSLMDSAYGSLFFLMTGFHGLHVLVGLIMLFVSTVRLFALHYSSERHLGFEVAAWYWHFVDVVWLLLFVSVYWWGS